MPHGPQEYISAALALLDEQGIADPSLGISVRAATAGAGVARSTIYRHWETVADLNDDLAIVAIADADGWQRQVLATPPATPLAAAVEQAVTATWPAPGAIARVLLAGWTANDRARSFAQEWERGWTEAFSAWLLRHLAATGQQIGPTFRGDRPEDTGVRALVAAVTAIVEGHLIVDLYRRGAAVDTPRGDLAERIGAAVAWLAGAAIEPAEAPGGQPGPDTGPDDLAALLPASGIVGAKLDIARRVFRSAQAHPFGEECSPTVSRVVDPARLARRLGITERRLFDVWPTAASCNIDVIRGIAERERVEVEELIFALLDIGSGDEAYEDFTALSTMGLERCTRNMVRPDHIHVFACSLLVADPAARSEMVEIIDGHIGAMRTYFFAAIGMTRWYRRTEINGDDYVQHMIAVMVGTQRLAALTPSVLDEELWFDGRRLPFCGTVNMVVSRSMMTLEPPTGRIAAAPHLALAPDPPESAG